ncbi:MAG TPA: hypothetical protein VIK92_01240 [Thermaerobacter sp.]
MADWWLAVLFPLLGLMGLFFLLRPVPAVSRRAVVEKPEPKAVPSRRVPEPAELIASKTKPVSRG